MSIEQYEAAVEETRKGMEQTTSTIEINLGDNNLGRNDE